MFTSFLRSFNQSIILVRSFLKYRYTVHSVYEIENIEDYNIYIYNNDVNHIMFTVQCILYEQLRNTLPSKQCPMYILESRQQVQYNVAKNSCKFVLDF